MTPNDYTNAVCACLRHATAKEKQAVAQELQDHLDDHAAALVEAGWDPEQAQAHALEAMGEAQEVGQALDREFPRRWPGRFRRPRAGRGRGRSWPRGRK